MSEEINKNEYLLDNIIKDDIYDIEDELNENKKKEKKNKKK